jgi:hypothetical protein
MSENKEMHRTLKEYLEASEGASEAREEHSQKVRVLDRALTDLPVIKEYAKKSAEMNKLLQEMFVGEEILRFQVFTGNGFIDVTTRSNMGGPFAPRDVTYHVSFKALGMRARDILMERSYHEMAVKHEEIHLRDLEKQAELSRGIQSFLVQQSIAGEGDIKKVLKSLQSRIEESKHRLEKIKEKKPSRPLIEVAD